MSNLSKIKISWKNLRSSKTTIDRSQFKQQLAELRLQSREAVIAEAEQQNIPYECDASGNLLWLGGSKERPFFLFPADKLSTNSRMTGTKTTNIVDVYRGFNGFLEKGTEGYERKIAVSEELKNKKSGTLYSYGATKYFCRMLLDKTGLHNELFSMFEGADLANMEVTDVHRLGRSAQKLIEEKLYPNGTTNLPETIDVLLDLAYYHFLIEELAIRSSGPEDGANASASGKYLSTLNVRNVDDFKLYVVKCIASLFNGEALTYHTESEDRSVEMQGINPVDYDFAILIMQLVPDQVAGGIVMTCVPSDNDTRHATVSVNYGDGQTVVQNQVKTPDTFIVSKSAVLLEKDGIVQKTLGQKDLKSIKREDVGTETVPTTLEERMTFSMTDAQVNSLVKSAILWDRFFGKEYGDHEFGIDIDGVEYHLQTRNETSIEVAPPQKTTFTLPDVKVFKATRNAVKKLRGGIKAGKSKIQHVDAFVYLELPKKSPGMTEEVYEEMLRDECMPIWEDQIKVTKEKYGKIALITEMTYPAMESLMKLCELFLTERGNKDGHTSIFARESRKIAIVGMAQLFAELLQAYRDGELKSATVDASTEDDGVIYFDKIVFDSKIVLFDGLPVLEKTKVLFNIGNANIARQEYNDSSIPSSNVGIGIGLGRGEDDLKRLGAHPLCFVEFDNLPKICKDNGYTESATNKLIEKIRNLSIGFATPLEYAIAFMANCYAAKAWAFPNDYCIIRLSDFKSNEYKKLLGGNLFEPSNEENPMLGYRGVARYIGGNYAIAFKMLECEAMRIAYYEKGATNIMPELPFIRSIRQAELCLDIMFKAGLLFVKDRNRVAAMFELDANYIFPKRYFLLFGKISVGGNDTVQTGMGDDRDGSSTEVTDEEKLEYEDAKCKQLAFDAKEFTHETGLEVFLNNCGNRVTTYPHYARKLVDYGFNAVSVVADAGIDALFAIAGLEPNSDQVKRFHHLPNGIVEEISA